MAAISYKVAQMVIIDNDYTSDKTFDEREECRNTRKRLKHERKRGRCLYGRY